MDADFCDQCGSYDDGSGDHVRLEAVLQAINGRLKSSQVTCRHVTSRCPHRLQNFCEGLMWLLHAGQVALDAAWLVVWRNPSAVRSY